LCNNLSGDSIPLEALFPDGLKITLFSAIAMGGMRNRDGLVAITGIGMITPLGVTTGDCWRNLVDGKSGIQRITRFDTTLSLTKIGGQIPEIYFEMEKILLSNKIYEQALYPSRLSILSARQALTDSGLSLDRIDRGYTGVITGSGGSSQGDGLEYGRHAKLGFTSEMLDAHALWLSREFDFGGPSFNVATACSSGAFAVGLGVDHVVRTHQICLVVGIDTMLLKETLDGFNQLLAISESNDYPEKASKPFDKRRNGFVLAEGACALLLEPYSHAMERKARIYAVISGYAFTSEAYNIMAPDPEGKAMAETMSMALENSKTSIDKIGYINAHGTSTIHNDIAETKAIKRVFGEKALSIPISSQKSMMGHTIGAAGAIETAVTALSLYHRLITPTINLEEPDPACDLDYVPNHCRKVKSLEAAITNSFGFGGHNSCIVLEKAPDNSV
jgi:3-oxoacyl-[acyl-carrier-protein] synthase II